MSIQEAAWERVAEECPEHRGADEHRHGPHFVHVVPMSHPDEIHCFAGEVVPGYPDFFRPKGGHVDLVPKGRSTPVYARKTHTYDMAERAGR